MTSPAGPEKYSIQRASWHLIRWVATKVRGGVSTRQAKSCYLCICTVLVGFRDFSLEDPSTRYGGRRSHRAVGVNLPEWVLGSTSAVNLQIFMRTQNLLGHWDPSSLGDLYLRQLLRGPPWSSWNWLKLFG
jgi:hypothetical protein